MTAAVQIAGVMNQAQFHRGPDGGGVWHDETAVLAHRRLAIIDLTGGTALRLLGKSLRSSEQEHS